MTVAVLLASGLVAPCVAPAREIVVDPFGEGDFTQIQPALDFVHGTYSYSGTPDTLTIMPGDYEEVVAFPAPLSYPWLVMLGPAGPDSTRVRGVVAAFADEYPWTYAEVHGLAVADAVDLGDLAQNFSWTDCDFESGFRGYGRSEAPNMRQCTFRGPVELLRFSPRGYWGPAFEDLRFLNAPLVASNGIGGLLFLRCHFEGAATTAARFYYSGESYPPAGFVDCAFANCANGVEFLRLMSGSANLIEHCTFTDIEGTAIRSDSSVSNYYYSSWLPELAVVGSRFERCGRVLAGSCDGALWMQADTLTDIDSTAIACRARAFSLRDLIVDGGGGDGIVIEKPLGCPYLPLSSLVGCWVSNVAGRGIVLGDMLVPAIRQVLAPDSYTADTIASCTVHSCGGAGLQVNAARPVLLGNVAADNRGDGIDLTGRSIAFEHSGYVDELASLSLLTGNHCERNGGAGIRVEGPRAELLANIAHANLGDGIRVTTVPDTIALESPPVLRANTSVANHGDGIRLNHVREPADMVARLERNLAAFNDGAGVRAGWPVPAPYVRAVLGDAWANAGGGFVGIDAPSDSNLALDPRFCDLAAGDLTLQGGSPCAPSGVFGLIGALPVACGSTAAVAAEPQPLAFALYPNPARGRVGFAIPPGLAEGRVEVFDLQGRARWRTDVRAGQTRVEWNGQTDSGALAPGLYWARLVAPGLALGRRFIWLN